MSNHPVSLPGLVKTSLLVACILNGILPVSPASAAEIQTLTRAELEKQFAEPLDSTKPRTYWYWVDGRQTLTGITKDLEAMKRAGVGQAYIGFIGGEGGDTGPAGRSVNAMTEEWWSLIEHAIREGGRLGVDIGLFNGIGWSQSGGPWNSQEKGMRSIVTREVRVQGPAVFNGTIAPPTGALPGQDVRTIAFPEPLFESGKISGTNATISGGAEVAKMFDGNMATSAEFPITGGQRIINVQTAAPFTARSLVLHPGATMISNGELQKSDDGVNFTKVIDYYADRRYGSPYLGPETLAPISLVFPPVSARYFRITVNNEGRFAEIELTGAAKIEDYSEKHFGKMFQGPKPPADYYNFPVQNEPDDPALCIPPSQVLDISSHRNGDQITWQVPEGNWVIQRMSMAFTGSGNTPVPPGGGGPEVDKINRESLTQHFDGYVGRILERMPPADRTALKHVVIDSYEVGSQTWTDGMAASFQAKFSYDPLPFLPALGGRIVGSAELSDRFLWDFRHFLSDRLAEEYIGGMKELSQAKGLRLWSQNYGHGGFFGEFLKYGGAGDEISGEFWQNDTAGQVETRCASSAAHIYGKNTVYAEGWTGGQIFQNTPAELKQMGDWAFCDGISHLVFHVNLMQPSDVRPGISAWFGGEFNRNNTWYDKAGAWAKYLQRCHTLLKQGTYVADVAYYVGEDVPKFVMDQKPALPAGYSYDYMNAEVIMERMSVSNGRFVLPDGMSYRLLVLPEESRMRPEVLQKIRDLVAQGGAVYGAPPMKSPSLRNYPECDTQVSQIATEMWHGIDGQTVKTGTYGSGKIFRNGEIGSILQQLSAGPDLSDAEGLIGTDIRFIHRRTPGAEIYFLSNQTPSPISFTPSFRVAGKAPELWDPTDGTRKPMAVYNIIGGRTLVPVDLPAWGSAFVVFQDSASDNRIVKASKDGGTFVDLTTAGPTGGSAPSTFSYSLWVKPSITTSLPAEAKTGFNYLYAQRAEIIFPAQGQLAWGDGHSGSGFSIGTNGVVVYEHGPEYFAPLLVHPVTINDWTHVAIVYENATTKLYLNGVLARTGLTSDFIVHAGTPNTSYNGRFSGFRKMNRAIDATGVQNLMQETGPGGSPGNLPAKPIELVREKNGGMGYLAWKSGTYALEAANGNTHELQVTSPLSMNAISGAWQVRFPSNSGAPSPTTLSSLAPLTEHFNPTIKYFSGTAIYSKNISVSPGALATGRRLFLDLGSVGSMAKVIINGKDLGTCWTSPYRFDITTAVKGGQNQVQVWVTNAWHNRLVGAKLSPQSFTGAGVEQIWASTVPNYGPDQALLPSGLIGPVRLLQAETLGESSAAQASAGAAIHTFTGGDPGEGVDLTGTVVHALNLGGDGTGTVAPDRLVSGVTFKDTYGGTNLVPVVTVGYQAINNWNSRPIYPSPNASDENLAEVMWDVAHGAGIPDEYPAVTFSGLSPEKLYQLQVLASDNDAHPNRATTYHLYAGTSRNGVLQDSATDLNLTALQGSTPGSPVSNGVVVTLTGTADRAGNLYFCSPDGIVGSGTGPFDPNGVVSALVLREMPADNSPFHSWITASYPSLSETERAMNADPDADGVNNLVEFALGGNPANSSLRGYQREVLQDISPPEGKELTIVFAARRGADFSAGAATVDGISYQVQGSRNLQFPGAGVTHLGTSETPPSLLNWPNLSGTEWEYHTFKLDGSDTLPGSGFLRLMVTPVE